MRRYIVLAGSVYYPSKWDDYRQSFDDLEQAKAFGDGWLVGEGCLAWYQVIDLTTMTVAAEKEIRA